MSFWSVVQCESRLLAHSSQRQQTLAERLFAQNGFESYLPQIKTRQHGKTRIAPLFPGYIFVRVIDRWIAIEWTVGVIRILKDGDRPSIFPDVHMDKLRKTEVGGFIKLPAKQSLLRTGQKVRVVTGSFQGHIGLYDGQSPHERERVLLDLLGRQVRVELAKGDRVVGLAIASA
jgi:transcription antitermination factor NusG